MEGKAFFLDSYAIYEITAGNTNYRKYAQGIRAITTRLNLMEIYYAHLRKGARYADDAYERFLGICSDFSDTEIKEAMKIKAKLKSENSKSNISCIDALGYTIALNRKLLFLTGDREFRGMVNVEFVE